MLRISNNCYLIKCLLGFYCTKMLYNGYPECVIVQFWFKFSFCYTSNFFHIHSYPCKEFFFFFGIVTDLSSAIAQVYIRNPARELPVNFILRNYEFLVNIAPF